MVVRVVMVMVSTTMNVDVDACRRGDGGRRWCRCRASGARRVRAVQAALLAAGKRAVDDGGGAAALRCRRRRGVGVQ